MAGTDTVRGINYQHGQAPRSGRRALKELGMEQFTGGGAFRCDRSRAAGQRVSNACWPSIQD